LREVADPVGEDEVDLALDGRIYAELLVDSAQAQETRSDEVSFSLAPGDAPAAKPD
jgi:hypothetical protein